MDAKLIQQTKQTICKPSENVSQERSLSSTKSIFGKTPDEFLRLYNPTTGARLLSKGWSSGQIAKLDNIPRLSDVALKFGDAVAHRWIEVQLLSLDTIQGQTSYTPEAKAETTHLILFAYGDMNVAELMNFFTRYKLGEYDNIYAGGLQRVLIALARYKAMRDDNIIRIECDEEHSRAEQEYIKRADKCISYEEYQRQLVEKL